MKELKDLKKGEWFTLKPYEYPKENQVYINNGYIKTLKKYEICRFDDICHTRIIKGNTKVYTDFIF